MCNRIIVMGVSGSGKSTLAAAIAERLRFQYIEGDNLHAPKSVQKMAAGIALDDADRWPWLDRIGRALRAGGAQGGVVASCSALRRDYRDRLRESSGQHLRFVMIDLPKDDLEKRMRERTGHYMPPALLESQLVTLEHPGGESDVLVLDGRQPLEDLVGAVVQWRIDLLVRGETFSKGTQ